jgi:hypothetical protein
MGFFFFLREIDLISPHSNLLEQKKISIKLNILHIFLYDHMFKEKCLGFDFIMLEFEVVYAIDKLNTKVS